MNERIKELALQAGFKTDRLGHLFGGDDIEKFAELIVQECIDINKQELAFNAFERLFNRYQEHFGVEE